jgi:hypothetical protein
MSAGLALGVAGVGIQIVDDAVKVIIFIRDIIHDSKHFGEDIRPLRTRTITETARLQAFSGFMKQIDDQGKTRFDSFPLINQKAILGMMLELELLFAGYSKFVREHDINELQRGYEPDLQLKSNVDTVMEKAGKDSARVQKQASLAEKMFWGIFEKRRILSLLKSLEDWNSRLMGLLLCGLCFGPQPIVLIGSERVTM